MSVLWCFSLKRTHLKCVVTKPSQKIWGPTPESTVSLNKKRKIVKYNLFLLFSNESVKQNTYLHTIYSISLCAIHSTSKLSYSTSKLSCIQYNCNLLSCMKQKCWSLNIKETNPVLICRYGNTHLIDNPVKVYSVILPSIMNLDETNLDETLMILFFWDC